MINIIHYWYKYAYAKIAIEIFNASVIKNVP